MKCENCGKEFHHCGGCEDDGYSEYGFCSLECQEASTECKHESVKCMDCGVYLN